MKVSVALGIPHAPWRSERIVSYRRLASQLLENVSIELAGHRVFADREPNYSWSAKLWQWAVDTGATHLLQLQDDVIVAPNFWSHLGRMLEGVPNGVIGLEAVHPNVANVTGCWYKTYDCLIGVGYVVPTTLLRDFLEWRSKLRKGAIESVSEDTLLGVWCMVTDHGVWHPVPTIVDHDVDLPSTYGNDAHGHRKPLVTWQDRPVTMCWKPVGVPNLGRFYEATPRLARRWIVGATEEGYQRWMEMR